MDLLEQAIEEAKQVGAIWVPFQVGRLDVQGRHFWCRCRCGIEREVRWARVKGGKYVGCGVCSLDGKTRGVRKKRAKRKVNSRRPNTVRKPAVKRPAARVRKQMKSSRSNRYDLSGRRFGEIIVLRRAEGFARHPKWECVCVLGHASVRRRENLHEKSSCKACATARAAGRRLLRARRVRKRRVGCYGRHPLRAIWRGMIRRCTDPRSSDYNLYGGRGIRVCERWMSIHDFAQDMGPRPSPKHSIDRIDGSGNYEPGNCRWATAREQARNMRSNRYLSFRGRTMLLADWPRETGIPIGTIVSRLRNGWDVEKALGTPSRHKKRKAA